LKLETDKILFALGGIILGFGVLDLIESMFNRGARSYAAFPFLGSSNNPYPPCPQGQVRDGQGKCHYPPIRPAPGPGIGLLDFPDSPSSSSNKPKPGGTKKGGNNQGKSKNGSSGGDVSQPSSSPPSSGGGGGKSESVACSPGQLPTDISNTECHNASSGGSNIPREESSIPQPGGNFKYSTIVSIPCDEKPDDVTIEFNGKAHSGNLSNRNGHKFMISVAGGDGKEGFYVQTKKSYDKQSTFNYNLDRCKTYGIVVTSQIVGSDTVSNLYIQNISAGESSARLVHSHRQTGGAAYASVQGARIGNRIDNIKSPCGQCCPDGSPKVKGTLLTKCASVS
jgi:hypothetical protein